MVYIVDRLVSGKSIKVYFRDGFTIYFKYYQASLRIVGKVVIEKVVNYYYNIYYP